jgi:hypothetical protein
MRDFKVEWARCKIPASYAIDDGNVLKTSSFLKEFTDWMLDNGIKGKFSVIPCPFGKGRIDKKIEGIDNKELEEFNFLIRNKLMQGFDVSPELVTHKMAWDIDRNAPMEDSPENKEDVIFARKNKEEQIEYVSFALSVLKNAGILANGVTSPWMLNSLYYPEAILEAEKKVNNIKLTWFLYDHGEGYEIFNYNRTSSEACVHIHYTCRDYIGYDEENVHYSEDIIDKYINARGNNGRIIELINKKIPMVILNHWQGLYNYGRKDGLKIIKKVLSRINKFLDNRIIWMKWSELARYYVCKEKLEYNITQTPGCIEIKLESPFECPDFTVSFSHNREPKEVTVDNAEILSKTRDISNIKSGNWAYKGNRVYLTIPLKRENKILARV